MNTIQKKVAQFFSAYTPQTYKKGDILIRADENPNGIFYLKSGQVKKYAISQKGEELVVNLFKPLSFFPMSWAINQTANAYFYEAVTETVVWKAPTDRVVSFVKQEPDVLYDLLSRIYKGMDGLVTRMTYLMAGSAYTRLVTELVIYAKRFGGEKTTHIELLISEKDLASTTGLKRETISREMKTLKNKKLVEVGKKKIIVVNVKALAQEIYGGV